jgi:flavin reductase (DIM6/NTAB) family NADH-FMN oxidoreductase RutF
MKTVMPGDIPHSQLHKLLLGAIGPRPIAFASTVDAEGNPNLSPFSFFNLFGVNPTTFIFSPSRRNRDNTTKNTYENVKVVPEVVINAVTFEMVNQASLASTEYPKGVDEFIKAGFTRLPSEIVRPFRVKESPVQIECRVRNIIETGQNGGAGNLIICEMLVMHVNEDILSDDGLIDQQKIRLVGRMGRDWYCKAFGDGIFRVEKPIDKIGIGIDALPEKIRFSKYLTGNNLGRLGNLERLPDNAEIDKLKDIPEIKAIWDSPDRTGDIHKLALKYLDEGRVFEALMTLMLL